MVSKLKSYGPYVAIIAFFIIISFAYFSPVLEGRALPQMDNTHAIGMAKELVDYEKQTGEKSQWTNSMFGGMPAYQIKADSSGNLFSYVNKYSRVGLPYHTVAILFLYLLGFFVLMRSMGFNFWLSALGSVAFAFGSYNIIIIIAGHITKAYAIALMAPVLAGILYTYNKNKWGGALFTLVALGAEIAYNHVQITYYLALLILILVLDKLSRAIANNSIPDFLSRTGLLVAAALIAILPNVTNLWTTYEYGNESIRGKSELMTEETQKKRTGLEPDYAFAWSYGKSETLTLLIPNFMGGASEPIGKNPRAIENTDDSLKQHVSEQSQYWGGKPFTSGPVYAGAIICFLFVLALFFYKGREKWWLFAGTILSILLAWGNNLEWFNMFMFDYFPLYNKFRTVEMALVVASLTIPILALLGLKEVIENPEAIREKTGYFMLALGLTGGVALVFYLFPGLLSFMNNHEYGALSAQKAANPDQAAIIDLFIYEIKQARAVLLKTDAFRTLIFIALGSGSLWFYAAGRIAAKYVLPGLLVLVLIDLWGVDKRYLNDSHFVPQRQMRQLFTPTAADQEILADKDPNFRVFSVYRNPFNEVHTSYFHKSIGGYHGAKLQIYQDVIDNYLQYYMQHIMRTLQQVSSLAEVEDVVENMPVINMLNTRYIIFHPEMSPLKNRHAMGNAWLVNNLRMVTSYKEEIDALSEENLHTTAIIHSEFANILEKHTVGANQGSIELTSYAPDKLKYEVKTGSPQLAVFSEIYYTGGWKAFVNGQEAPIIRTNYILRGVFVPAGESSVEFRFEPKSYRYGKIISIITSISILLLIVLYIIKRKKFSEE